jgi:hypothetical protein
LDFRPIGFDCEYELRRVFIHRPLVVELLKAAALKETIKNALLIIPGEGGL